MRIIRCSLLVLFTLSYLSLSAQESAFNAGVRLGGGYSVNSHVDKILVSENYYSNYSFDNKGQFVPSAELFFFIGSLQAYGAWKRVSPIITRRREFVTRTRTN